MQDPCLAHALRPNCGQVINRLFSCFAHANQGVEFGQIRVVETGLVGYIKARHLHTEEKAQALAAKKQTKRLSFAKAKSSDNKDKNIKSVVWY